MDAILNAADFCVAFSVLAVVLTGVYLVACTITAIYKRFGGK